MASLPQFVFYRVEAAALSGAEVVEARHALRDWLTERLGPTADLVEFGDDDDDEPERRSLLLLRAPQEAVDALRPELPAQVMMEETTLYVPQWTYPYNVERGLPLAAETTGTPDANVVVTSQGQKPAPVGGVAGSVFDVEVMGNGQPLRGATVLLSIVDENGVESSESQATDQNGRAHFHLDEWKLVSVTVEPKAGYWSEIRRNPPASIRFDLQPLPAANGSLGWWHRRCGINQYRPTRGAGIRVGLIDTGIGPHPYLNPQEEPKRIFLYGRIGTRWDRDPTLTVDADQHGTHVAGIIAARPWDEAHYAGLAPGCELHVVRVVVQKLAADSEKMAKALGMLVNDAKVDLINLSLATPDSSEPAVGAAIRAAAAKGVLCICAGGNDKKETLTLPARLDDAVGVGAIGIDGPEMAAPAGTSAAAHRPGGVAKAKTNGALFLANFSNFGTKLDCVAPGVGIISTVPVTANGPDVGPTPYMVFDGTSMAAPMVCGLLAGWLADREDYKAMARNVDRTNLAREILLEECVSLGLPVRFEGRGLPVD